MGQAYRHRVTVEKRYAAPAEPLYLVGTGWSYEWGHSEVDLVIKLWTGGHRLTVIAGKVDRTPWDVLMLLNDLAESGSIKERRGNLRGWL